MSAKSYGGSAHPIASHLRRRRKAAGMSLDALSDKLAIPAVVLGSWERGDRQPTLGAVDLVLAHFGEQLAAVPIGTDVDRLLHGDPCETPTGAQMAGRLRRMAEQLERLDHAGGAAA